MTKFGTMLLLLAGVAFASLAIGAIFFSWLIIPLVICIIVCDVFVDDLPPWFILNDIWGAAQAFAFTCLVLGLVFHHSAFTQPAPVASSPEQFSLFGALCRAFVWALCISVTSVIYSRWVKPRIENCNAFQVWMHKRMMKRISKAFERCQIPEKGN
jgi:hypothetical protein